MAKVIFGEETVTADIRLEDISREAYKRIRAFIDAVLFPRQGELKEEASADVPAEAGKTEEAVPVPEETPKRRRGEKHDRKINDGIGHLMQEVRTQPERYERVWMTATDFMKRVFPDWNANDKFSVGVILTDLSKRGVVEKRRGYNRERQQYESTYFVPVPKAETGGESEVVPAIPLQDARLGKILQRNRLEHGFSLAEIAKMIGVTVIGVMKWESGEYHMSPNIIKKINDIFKKDIFAEEASA